MAHVILGLLLVMPMSLYDILRAFDHGISQFYASSSGSIKRALDKLVDSGEIEVASQEPTGRRRKVYAATEKGRARFDQWIRKVPAGEDFDTGALARVYFLGLVPAHERVEVLESLRDNAQAGIATLDALDVKAQESETNQTLGDIAHYALSTLDYGQRAHRTGIEWLTELIDDALAASPAPKQ